MNDRGPTKHVYTFTERGERSFWTRIGAAFVNRDGSVTVRLNALPLNGTLQIRDSESDRSDPARAPRD